MPNNLKKAAQYFRPASHRKYNGKSTYKLGYAYAGTILEINDRLDAFDTKDIEK